MNPILQFLLEWFVIGLGAAIGFGIMVRKLEQEDREREEDQNLLG